MRPQKRPKEPIRKSGGNKTEQKFAPIKRNGEAKILKKFENIKKDIGKIKLTK